MPEPEEHCGDRLVACKARLDPHPFRVGESSAAVLLEAGSSASEVALVSKVWPGEALGGRSPSRRWTSTR